jgi:hypothetical protein
VIDMAKKKSAEHGEKKMESFSIRVPAAVKDRLLKAKDKSGGSLNDEILRCLNLAFRMDELAGKQHHGLARGIADMADTLRQHTGQHWMSSPWATKTLALAIPLVVNGMGAQGDAKPPTAKVGRMSLEPESYSAFLAETVLSWEDIL